MFEHGFGMLFGAFWGFSVIGLVLLIWALIDCLQVPDDSRYQSGTKLIWVLVIVFVWIIGPILYLAIGRPKGGAARPGAHPMPPPAPGAPRPPAGSGDGMPPPPPGALG
jgi:Phospholipase_D-nuclease N-terminal